ncbi:isochorismatase family protein [Marinibaculum pumilum]|uniref:Isochorismatase family protein n=1 Tax=Marinibaculum pumilum TaxID=1766165 RepID=A0ABV7L4D9_9PROT
MPHPFELPQDVADRIIGRRGRLNVYDRLEPAKTALLVVDLQVAFLDPGADGTGGVAMAREIVPDVNRLASALRAAGGRVVWIVSTYGPDPDDRWTNLFDHMLGPERAKSFRDGLTMGAAGHRIWPELERLPEDWEVSKNRFGAFLGSRGRLERQLRDAGIDTVLVAGTITNVCCDCTAREAAALDFKTVFVADANAGRSDREHNAALANFLDTMGDVRNVDEVIEMLHRGSD